MLILPSNNFAYKRIAGTNPAANTEVTEIVPAGKYYYLFSVYLPLVQGLTQTPQPVLQITDDLDNILAELFGSTAAQAASTTCAYTWAAGIASTSGQIGSGANIRSYAPIPTGLILGPGFKIKTVTVGIGANTDYGVPSLYVAQFS